MKAAVFVKLGRMEVQEVTRPGAIVGRVGAPHTGDINIGDYWMANLAMAGGPASCTTYDKEVLLKAVLDGQINPGKVFTQSYKLDEIDQTYKDMADRKTIKAMIVMQREVVPIFAIQSQFNERSTTLSRSLFYRLHFCPKVLKYLNFW